MIVNMIRSIEQKSNTCCSDEELLNLTFEYAVGKKITSLCDACLYLEKSKRKMTMNAELKDSYTEYLASQKMPLMY